MEIRIAAAAIMRSDGATLLVRKRGTSAFMQPGGKIDGDEFSAPAANEPDCTVSAELFRLDVNEEFRVLAEIEEARWVTRTTYKDIPLAPLTEYEILPVIW